MPRSHFASLVFLFYFFSITGSRAIAQCEIGWSRPVQFDYPDHEAYLRAEFDEDGGGPNPPWTIFCGYIGSAGGIPVSGMAAWNGTYWQPFPGESVPPATVTTMLAVDMDGPGPERPVLWAGGTFSSINGIAAGKVARFDHGAWHGVADGIPTFPFDRLRKFVAWDEDRDGPLTPVIYAQADEGVIARLVGGAWESVGASDPPGFKASGLILADLDGVGPEHPTLVRMGRFLSEPLIGEVQKWTGAQWERIGGVFNRVPSYSVLFDPDQNGPLAPELYVGGVFDLVGSTTARGIARWRDNQWQPLETQLLGAPHIRAQLQVGDDDGDGPRPQSLFVNGEFALPGASGLENRYCARWDGARWEGLGGLLNAYECLGTHMNIRGQRTFRWFVKDDFELKLRQPSGWRFANDSNAYNYVLDTIDLDGPGPLGKSIVMVGSDLEGICDGVAKSAASWDGKTWSPIADAPLPGAPSSFCMFDFDYSGPAPPQLILSGRFTFNEFSYATVVLQNGAWVPIPSSVLSGGSSERGGGLTVYDSDGDGPVLPVLMLGGTFHSLDYNPSMAYLAKWTLQGWAPASPLLDRAVVDMLVQDDDGSGPIQPALYVAGPMSVGSTAVNGVARWDGLNWRPLVEATTGEVLTPNPVSTMCSLQEEPGRNTLCVGGSFSTTQGFVHAARWKNSHWSPMGATLPAYVSRMVGHSEINGVGINTTVYCAASTSSLSDRRNLYRWNGQDWQKLTNYTSSSLSPIWDIRSIDLDGNGPLLPQICNYGGFTNIPAGSPGAGPAANIAFWGPRQPYYFATPWYRSIAAGDRLSLRVATDGAEPMTFAWTRDGLTLADGGTISGATTRELVINPVGFGDSGQYECVATNGCGSIPSGPTLVRVCAALANGDLNGDGSVNGLDISPFVTVWTTPPSPQSDCPLDLNHNGIRDPQDLDWFIGRLLAS